MEKANSQDPKSTSTRSQLDDGVSPNRLVGIAEAYPDNLIVRCFVVPFARHPFKCLLAVCVLFFGSLITCNFWNDDKVCDGRFLSMTFYVSLGFMILICYTGYLRRKLARQRRFSQEA